MSTQSVADLLERAGAGDRQAWGELVERYHRLVWSVIRNFRFDDTTSDDVFQMVWQRLIENCDRIREPERLAGWLATTARNEALRVLRDRERVTPSPFELDVTDPIELGLDERLVESELQRDALRAFAKLPPDAQELIRLLCADPPIDYQTIAEIVGRPVGSIGPTRQRILNKLRTLMADEPGGTGE